MSLCSVGSTSVEVSREIWGRVSDASARSVDMFDEAQGLRPPLVSIDMVNPHAVTVNMNVVL